MADVAKSYGVGDSVWVYYPGKYDPAPRTVKRVDIITGTNEAEVSFSDGPPVIDGAKQRVFDTQALAADAMRTDIATIDTYLDTIDTV